MHHTIKPTRNPLTILLITGCMLACDKTVEESPQHTKSAPHTPAYLNAELDIDTRVEDLVARMDIAEKISQMYNESPAIERLGVHPYDWWNEALHGVARAGKATVFPQAIGMAAMWSDKLMLEIATAISDEARAKHHYFLQNHVIFRYTGLTFWSPNINIFRDPRWGRGQETYGEDPFLTATLAVPFIRGLQGNDPKYLKTAAMAKHYAVHSGPEKSRHSDNYIASSKDLYETYLPAFEKAVVDANVESVMCAYNRVNGEPACGNDQLLKDILRGKWQFQGHVVSDCGAIADFYAPEAHAVVLAPAQAAAWAVRSGTDLNCGTGRLSTFANLHFALQRGLITEAEIDTAVKHLFKTRFKLGMFDPPEQVAYAQIPMDVVGSEKHLALTQKAAEKSFVLLKNDGILPLKKDITVAVIGPNATNPTVLVGNYHGEPIKPVTPLQGIRDYHGEKRVSYAPGSALAANQFGHFETIEPKFFFHKNIQGELQPGLEAAYYHADKNNGRDTNPVFKRIDANIDFYWARSPIDQTVRDEYSVVWQGYLKPLASGIYLFDSREKIYIDGEIIEDEIYLNADQLYNFKAEQTFLHAFWGQPLEPFAKVRWINRSENLIGAAVSVAKHADVIIFTGGISADLEGEEMDVVVDGFDHGDRTQIKLPKSQEELLKILYKLNKPIVLVNFSGSAMALNWENDHVNAILQGFYPGEASGSALSRILWGEVSPSGRLPITFYKGTEDLPEFKDYSMNNRTYKYYQGEVLYPFGHGLSYTQFSYSELRVPQQIAPDTPLSIEATISNTGTKNSDEVVQLYVAMKQAPVKVPQIELKGFQRVNLAPGEQQTILFNLRGGDLTYIDEDGTKKPYEGNLYISVGSGQPKYLKTPQFVETTLNIKK